MAETFLTLYGNLTTEVVHRPCVRPTGTTRCGLPIFMPPFGGLKLPLLPMRLGPGCPVMYFKTGGRLIPWRFCRRCWTEYDANGWPVEVLALYRHEV